MRVLLIAPDMPWGPSGNGGATRRKALLPPLSLLQVAALTPPDVEVAVQDEAAHALDFDAPCDLVGLTASTYAAPRAYQIAEAFRARGVPVVMGGVHVTARPEEALAHCDAVVIGEAEGKWERLLADAQAGRLAPRYEARDFPDLTRAPAPRRELVPREDYLVPDSLQATRGCAHNCAFCSVTSVFGHRPRSRDVEAVAEDASALPGKHLLFVDDNILMQPAYARQLFESLVGTGKRWVGQASTAMLQDAALLKLAARSGCQLLFIGLESLSSAALSGVNKSFNAVARFKDLIARLHDDGIGAIGAFMFGFDEDDESVFARTAAFADQARIDVPQYSILTPLPGTAFYRRMEQEGRILDRNWSHYDGQHAVFRPQQMSPERLLRGFKEALQHSYSRLSILQRVAGLSPRQRFALAVNQEFRRRAIPYVHRRG